MFRMFLFKLQIKLPGAFPASRQGWHYIRPDVPPKGWAHDGPGAQNMEHEVSTWSDPTALPK